MKKSLILLLLLCTISIKAQDGLSFGVYQDGRLLLLGDDHGNSPGTLDTMFHFDMQGKQFEYYFFTVRSQFEFADLSGGKFYRYSVHGLWTFNKLIIPKLQTTIGIGIGMIHRDVPIKTPGLGSHSFTGEIKYPISKHIFIGLRLEYVDRSDLRYVYNNNERLKPNISAGIEYKL